jgi:hypothetical protein
VLGALTWSRSPRRAHAASSSARVPGRSVVDLRATVAEVTGSIIWGVYSYRLHNLPTFVPPAHGLVFIAGSR